MRWNDFTRIQWGTLTATDFFTPEVCTAGGLITFLVLFVIDLKTRPAQIVRASALSNNFAVGQSLLHFNDCMSTQCRMLDVQILQSFKIRYNRDARIRYLGI